MNYPSDIVKLKICRGRGCTTINPNGLTKRYTEFDLDLTRQDRLTDECRRCGELAGRSSEEKAAQTETPPPPSAPSISEESKPKAEIITERICKGRWCVEAGKGLQPIGNFNRTNLPTAVGGYTSKCRSCLGKYHEEREEKERRARTTLGTGPLSRYNGEPSPAPVVDTSHSPRQITDSAANEVHAAKPRTLPPVLEDPRFDRFFRTYAAKIHVMSDLSLLLEAAKHVILATCEDDPVTRVLLSELDRRT